MIVDLNRFNIHDSLCTTDSEMCPEPILFIRNVNRKLKVKYVSLIRGFFLKVICVNIVFFKRSKMVRRAGRTHLFPDFV